MYKLILGILLVCLAGCSTTNQIPIKDDCCSVKSK